MRARDEPGRTPSAVVVRQASTIDPQVRREVEALRDFGYAVDLVMERGARQSLDHPLPGIAVIELPVHRQRGVSKVSALLSYAAFATMATVVVAARHVRRRYRLVQVSTMPDPLVVVGLVPKWLGAHLVLFVKEPVPELFQTLYGANARRSATLRRIQRWSLRRADAVLTVTDDLREVLVENGASPDRTFVVLNASSVGGRPAHLVGTHRDPTRFTVVCHGLMAERYGLDIVIRAVAVAARDVPGLRLWLIGDGPDRELLGALVRQLGADEVVTFPGFLPEGDLLEYLASADVGMVPQLRSPYSDLVHTTKMFEYFAFGLPVLATRLRATERLLPDGAVAWVDPGDPQHLAAMIVELFGDEPRRQALGHKSSALAEQLGWRVQREAYLRGVGASTGTESSHS